MSIQSYSFIDSADPLSPPDLATKRYVDAPNPNLKVPYVRAYRAAALSFTGGTAVNPFIFDTRVAGTDPGTNYNTSTGIYTCPIAGLYFLRAAISVGQTAAGSVTTQWLWNGGAALINNNFQSIGTSAIIGEVSGVILAAAGDTFQVSTQSSVSNPLRAVPSETNMQVAWLAGGPL